MRVTFDSNTFQCVIRPSLFSKNPYYDHFCSVHEALKQRIVSGFVCETLFTIEPVKPSTRSTYFAEDHLKMVMGPRDIVRSDGLVPIFSLMPDDRKHPALAPILTDIAEEALTLGFRVLRATRLGMARPGFLLNPQVFVQESLKERIERERRFAEALHFIQSSGSGKAAYDKNPTCPKAPAEWADGDTVAAHIAYGNDIMCTHDFGKSQPNSVFGPVMRKKLVDRFGVKFATISELAATLESTLTKTAN